MDPLLGLIWLLLKIIRLKFDNITPHDHGICANLEDAQKMASRSVVYSCTKLLLYYIICLRKEDTKRMSYLYQGLTFL
jgi:hypothetical protein